MEIVRRRLFLGSYNKKLFMDRISRNFPSLQQSCEPQDCAVKPLPQCEHICSSLLYAFPSILCMIWYNTNYPVLPSMVVPVTSVKLFENQSECINLILNVHHPDSICITHPASWKSKNYAKTRLLYTFHNTDLSSDFLTVSTSREFWLDQARLVTYICARFCRV